MSACKMLWGIPRPSFVRMTEQVFFAGMLRGYAFGYKGEPHPRIPGWKRILCVIGGCWLVVDEWCDEGGRTLVLYEPTRAILRHDCCIPVWGMTYSGQYPEQAIPCLKAALTHQYERKDFCAGRGPIYFPSEKHGMSYHNSWSGTFEKFEAKECVRDGENREIMGEHTISGGMLI